MGSGRPDDVHRGSGGSEQFCHGCAPTRGCKRPGPAGAPGTHHPPSDLAEQDRHPTGLFSMLAVPGRTARSRLSRVAGWLIDTLADRSQFWRDCGLARRGAGSSASGATRAMGTNISHANQSRRSCRSDGGPGLVIRALTADHQDRAAPSCPCLLTAGRLRGLRLEGTGGRTPEWRPPRPLAPPDPEPRGAYSLRGGLPATRVPS